MSYCLKSSNAAPFQLEQSSLGACVGQGSVGGNHKGDNKEATRNLVEELKGGRRILNC